ncbi:hypothetical protein DP939_15015 [Spongiactinospora rosea]|uniref:Uncharacterized protein n=1 Tax=Spongiactinospora rosea TaxID=2248750 RepID=A0A366LZ82_9ACTN|nr:hypothetical protein [Spongiactinospora rosea]RBQ19245.1 hypothetical protein DP939_15015 [Spongiactinospora rosea]
MRTVTRAGVPAAVGGPVRPGRVFAALLRFEALHLLRSPALWVAAVAVLGLRAYQTWNWLPDMSVETVGTVSTALLISATVLILANLAGTRDRRRGLPETLSALPSRARQRTSAVTVATAAVGATVSGAVMGTHLLARSILAEPAAGRFDGYEVIGGMAATALFAVVGVAIGRWVPSLVAGPLALAVLGCLCIFGITLWQGGWLVPVVMFHSPERGPRPSEAHAVYLMAMVVVISVLAALRHGVRAVPVVAGTVGLAVAVGAGAWVIRDAPPSPWLTSPRTYPPPPGYDYAAQVCRTGDAVTVCAFPDYQAWIPEWSKVVEPIATAVPPQARDAIPLIRQETLSRPYSGDDTRPTVNVWMTLPRRGAAEIQRAYLAGLTAATVTGLRNGRPGKRWTAEGSSGCGARGQARTLVALWLAGRSGPLLPAGGVRVWLGEGSVVAASQLGAVRYGAAELSYARRLLARPDARQRIWAAWDRLTDPKTSLAEALPALGLRAEFPIARAEGQPCA